MDIQDTDYFLIDDAGITKKVTALKLKDNMLGDYSSKKLLVNLSDNSSRFVYAGDMRSKLLDSHWMVVDSGGQTYKVSGTKVLDYLGPAPTGAGEDITTSFYEISNRFISSPSSDYTGAYDVGEVQCNFTGTGRVYIGVKVTAATTYYNDVPIAGVQILQGSTLKQSWIFYSTSGGNGNSWTTTANQISGSSSYGFPVTPLQASNYYFMSMSTSRGTGRFSWTTSTGSRYTGAADGISSSYTNQAAPVGNGQISQSYNTYYAYRETSGSTRYSGAIMRSPEYNFQGGEIIRVIHAVTGYSGTPMSAFDTLYVGVI